MWCTKYESAKNEAQIMVGEKNIGPQKWGAKCGAQNLERNMGGGGAKYGCAKNGTQNAGCKARNAKCGTQSGQTLPSRMNVILVI